MGYHTKTILDVSENTTGDACSATRFSHLLFVVTLTGTVTCAIQARQTDGNWKALDSFTSSGELNVENFGWHEIRAVTSGMSSATAKVVLSWR